MKKSVQNLLKKAMVRHFLVLLLSIVATNLYANGALRLMLTIKDNQGKPIANTEVRFIETTSRKLIARITNSQGLVDIMLSEGKIWQIATLKINDYYLWQIEIPKIPDGVTAQMTKILTYDYDFYRRDTRPAVDRTKLSLTKVAQNISPNETAKDTMGIVKLIISKADKSPLTNFDVQLTCYATATIFTTKTNSNGIAFFKVPINNEYQIDIDGIENFSYIDLPNARNYTATKTFTYEPTIVKETFKKDTILQDLTPNQQSTSARTLVSLTIYGGEQGIFPKEKVYLNVLKDTKVYEGTTDEKGVVKFLLPKGKRYMINFKYEENVDVIDLTRNRGIAHQNRSIRYRPVERLQYPERFIPKPEQLIVDDYIDDYEPKQKNTTETLKTTAVWGNNINSASKEAVLELGFSAEYVSGVRIGALNLAFVIDRSGSMSADDRIEIVKRVISNFTTKLSPDDVISIVTFDDHKTVILEAQKLGNDLSFIQEEIDRIETGGSTNIYDGLEEGYKQVLKNYRKASTNRVILLTDGQENTKKPEEIIAMSRGYNAKGIECSTIGIGDDVNFTLLKSLANFGGGVVGLSKAAPNIEKIFNDEMSSLLIPMAKNVKIEVIYDPKVFKTTEVYGFPLEEKKEGLLSIKLRNFYSGMAQLALINFGFVNPSKAIENQTVTIRTKYNDTRKNETVTTEVKTNLVFVEGTENLALITDEVLQTKYIEAYLRKSLRQMSEHFAAKNNAAAQQTLSKALAEYERLYPKGSNNVRVQTLVKSSRTYLDIFNNLK
jgi:uncharacterized protein YegL